MLSSDERLYVDKVCCSEIGSVFLSIFCCTVDGRPLSINYPDISTCSTHKAILYPLSMLYIYFKEQFFLNKLPVSENLRYVLFISVFVVSLHRFLS